MMSIAAFIQTEILMPRLNQAEVLVVYDPEQRYRQLCLALDSDKRRVVDASESSIESREQAEAALLAMGRPNPLIEQLLIYVPAREPLSESDKLRDPFAAYGELGGVFPNSDGERYQSLCERAKPDQLAAIRQIFADNPQPSFEMIDAVGDGAGWAQLRALLQVDSAREILHALLAPNEAQHEALTQQDTWVAEAKTLLQETLGMTLLTRSKKWTAISDELWRFVLFSEFIYDLPGHVPEALAQVPRCRPEARSVIDDVCARLRNDQRSQLRYIEKAEAVQSELNLSVTCKDVADLGQLDTFPFEERSFFAQAIKALQTEQVDQLQVLLAHHANSIWGNRGEHQAHWQLLAAAAKLIRACADGEAQVNERSHSENGLLAAYIGGLHHIDRLQRELEQAAVKHPEIDGGLHDVLGLARKRYRRLADSQQRLFLQQIERTGWPVTGQLANANGFDQWVLPKLQESGRRVALLLVDALRYELGAELYQNLLKDGPADLKAACAQLPSVTPVGMASLLPGAEQGLNVTKKEDKPLPMLDGQALGSLKQRMDVLRQRFGQRFAEVALNEFGTKRYVTPAGVELLLIRSNEMDSDFENNPDSALGAITHTMQKVRSAVNKLRELGFQDAIIMTDHGFFLNTALEAGDVCAKPAGTWVNVHERMLLGEGSADAGNVVLSAAALGIRGDFRQIASPRAMVAYQANVVYFHGGVSLQEAVVPIITLRLRANPATVARQPQVSLNYKRGKRITTRRPTIEVMLAGGDLFSATTSVEIMLEAQDKNGEVVGEAALSSLMSLSNRTLTLKPEQTVQVTLKMDMDYEGKFSVKALDPATLTTLAKLDLETDYAV